MLPSLALLPAHAPPSLAPHFPEPKSRRSDEPFLFALVDGLCEVGVVVHDGGVGALGRLRALRLVGVVGALVTEHVANEEDQGAEDGEDHHGDDPWGTQTEGREVRRGRGARHTPRLFSTAPSRSLSRRKHGTPNNATSSTGRGRRPASTVTSGDAHFPPRG